MALGEQIHAVSSLLGTNIVELDACEVDVSLRSNFAFGDPFGGAIDVEL